MKSYPNRCSNFRFLLTLICAYATAASLPGYPSTTGSSIKHAFAMADSITRTTEGGRKGRKRGGEERETAEEEGSQSGKEGGREGAVITPP